jgi:cytokinin riboside 5'-monophosphate phosphoribohydrolase
MPYFAIYQVLIKSFNQILFIKCFIRLTKTYFLCIILQKYQFMIKTICVFCSSSEDLDPKFYDITELFGNEIALRGYNLIHGAGTIGLMGKLMKATAQGGANVVGVVPERLNKSNIVSTQFQKLIVTADMKDRKEYMRENSDAFIALPGGFGTLEELLEVITLKQLKYHNKPIVIFNPFGFYNNIINQFEHFYSLKFTDESYRKLYFVTDNINEAFDYLTNYEAQNIYDKYLGM